ncbi:DUF3466 family protein [Enterovibrio calviensis]|uniref:DUF3466 family protein n=1 Tax=Enterovibrio calviensis TaxID=91359 RepID=UPI0004890889|nr:DUF3466 family protein [Enterovibrio calviensis]
MQFNKFKLSAVALAMAGLPLTANAALYSVERVDNASASQTAAATAISPDGNTIAVEVLKGPVGLNYSEELPYMVDVEHFINSRDDLDLYCDRYLGYSTCNTWSAEKWYGLKDLGEVCDSTDFDAGVCVGGLKEEIEAWSDGFSSNSMATVGSPVNPFGDGVSGAAPSGMPNADSTNVVVNSLTDAGSPVGASSSPYYDAGLYNARAFVRRGFVNDAELLPPASATGVIPTIGQTNANGLIEAAGVTITYGSASVANMADLGESEKVPEGATATLSSLLSCQNTVDYADRACQYVQFANQAAVWLTTAEPTTAINAVTVVSDFPSGTSGHDDDTAQASVLSAALLGGDTNKPYLVGYSTYDDNRFYARAVQFIPVPEFSNCISDLKNGVSVEKCWEIEPIKGFEDQRERFSYSMATGTNSAGVIVGVAKYINSNSGSFSENIFISQDGETTLLGTMQSSLFFSGYNATAAALNTDSELVGKVDIESSRDRERRQRGYIYAHGTASADFDGKRGWLLDDLTNGSGGANDFRIAEAFDIADNGNIAASAFYCAGGYSSTAQNALCDSEEELVAVKLTRLPGGDITPRPVEENVITRSGGSIGVLGLVLLGLGGVFRKRK